MYLRNNIHLNRKRYVQIVCAIVLLLSVVGCAAKNNTNQNTDIDPSTPAKIEGQEVTLVIGAYSVAKDALGELLPLFKEKWALETAQDVVFQESYEASGTQARAIIGGFDADVAILAMAGDIEQIVNAGLIDHAWQDGDNEGMVTRSIVVFGTRKGNPHQIKDWTDLAREHIKVMYPNPKTSGGAQWDINAIYGAGLKQSELELGVKDEQYAKQFLKSIHRNVESLDKSGRASMAAFEYGVGDVIVTYENELIARKNKGIEYEIIIPNDTILIENPIAIVDRHVEKHGNRAVAEAFVQFLYTDEAQRVFMEHGFRPITENIAAEAAALFKQPAGLFDIEYLGGWNYVRELLYSNRGIWYQVLADL